MSRWLVLLPLLLQACASGAEQGSEAAQAALASHRATMAALGAPAAGAEPTRPPAAAVTAPLAALPGDPRAIPGRIAAPLGGHVAPLTPPRFASSLLGASPDAVRAALGEPLLQRNEGPAEVWLYAAAGCQLDIVLYASEAGPRVAHVQARAGGLAQRTEASCLRDLANGAHASPVPAGRGESGGVGAAGTDPSIRRSRPPSSAIGHAVPAEIDA